MNMFRKSPGPLVCALGFSLLLLALTVLELHSHIARLSSGGVLGSVADQIMSSRITLGRLGAFAIAILALYLALGVMGWLLTLLTIRAVPRFDRRAPMIAIAWCMTLALLAGLANADLYPWSRTGKWSRNIAEFVSLPFPLWYLVACAAIVAVIILLLILTRRTGVSRQAVRVAAWSLVALVTIQTAEKLSVLREAKADPQSAGPPHIILIGIDSLRPSLVGSRDRLGYMPSLTSFVESGHRFTDATTPLARTFPSWMSMLTGLLPGTTGVRENLMPRSSIQVETVAGILARNGYKTVFATDDVRFSNIDAGYGFEEVHSPRIGVTDFLLGGMTDTPVTNLVANTRVGKWLLPDSYANRAAATTYDPDTFVEWLDSDVEADGRPLFLAMHLTLAHYPYRWRGDEDELFSRTSETAYAYLSAVIEVDRQFAAITRMLESKGLLKNALVVVFSDHGEGLNLPGDREILFEAAKQGVQGIPIWSSGHGNTVLSRSQYEIFMAARSFGISGFTESRGTHENPVSIEDVTPTVLEVAGIDVKDRVFDGISFAPLLASGRKGQGSSEAISLRVRFTESAYTTPALQQGVFDEISLMRESIGFFRIEPRTGWVEVNDSLWDHFLEVRERAAIGRDLVLAAVPAREPGTSWYVLVPRGEGELRKLAGRPAEEGEARQLWDALQDHYGREIGSPAP